MATYQCYFGVCRGILCTSVIYAVGNTLMSVAAVPFDGKQFVFVITFQTIADYSYHASEHFNHGSVSRPYDM